MAGLTSIELRQQTNLFDNTSLPRMLFHFRHLRSLTIKSRLRLSKRDHKWPALLSSFPATLVTLHISSEDSTSAFLNYAPESKTSSPKIIVTDYPRGPSRLVDLERMFPWLRTLEIGDGATFLIEDSAGLPSQLTRFNAQLRIEASDWSQDGIASFLDSILWNARIGSFSAKYVFQGTA